MLSQVISHYRILRHLGTSVVGEVYLAEDTQLRRKVVLTLLPETFVSDPARMRQLAQEARVLSSLNHPNIRVIYAVGQDAQRHYIVTEFVEGPTLREHLATTRMRLTEVLEVAVQLATGLTAAHTAGVLHRDLRPENIMIRPDGYVKILDFGLAKAGGNTGRRMRLVDAVPPAEPPAVGGTEIIHYPDPFKTAPLDATHEFAALLQTNPTSREQLWGIAGALSYYAPEHLRGGNAG